MSRLLVVSDSHLSPRAPEADTNWAAVVDYANTTDVDLVVHTGDISLDGASRSADLEHARAQFDRLSVPWLAIPGNHDLGDIAGLRHPTDDQRRHRYEACFGHRFWSTELGPWRLVGIDIQDLLSDGPDTKQWWQWLTDQLATDYRVAIFQHRPMTPVDVDEFDEPRRYVTEPARSRLQAMYANGRVEVVVSGHVHQWRSLTLDSAHHVWAPSTWATLPDSFQPIIGTKTVGLVELDLDQPDQASLVVPADMQQAIVGETIPVPYDT
ncbi:MAG: metallophosphoesterase [Actinomycetia bacterium]|nr:metallophosphoesterase [Actinomycetes bacterium]